MRKYFILSLVAALLLSCGKDAEKPTVKTLDVAEVTDTTAVCAGEIISNGGAEITSKGVCWSTTQNPTTEDHSVDAMNREPASDVYRCVIANLLPNTTYYVRAYAANEVGTGYGQEVSFTTLDGNDDGDDNGGNDDGDDDGNDDGGDDNGGDDEPEILLPEVSTSVVTEIDITSAVSGGEVVSDGGAEVIARGVCWSTSQNPTIDNKHTEDGAGVGVFTSNVINLAMGTTYYVRAYATNEAGTAYGEELSFTTLEGNFINGYEYVDLGLPSGLKWAAHNFGATMPYEIGSYLAWGEHKPKDMYSSSNSITYGINVGEMSGDIEFDAAAFSWEASWRIPTSDEARELIDNCTIEWTVMNNVQGALFTGPNGNQIFLPSGGFATEGNIDFADSEGAYWTSSPDPSDPVYYSTFFYFYNTNFANIGWFSRYAGLLVRPVSD